MGTVDYTPVEQLGYSVERPNFNSHRMLAYYLTGARGAVYGLMRYQHRPELMFVVRGKNGTICHLKGNYNFTDKGGVLRPVS